MNIYVGNLAYSMSREDLSQIFGQYGEVTRATIVTDRESGLSKGFGFVEMANDAEALESIEALNNFDYKGRALRVNEARPREDRPRDDRGPREDRAPRRFDGPRRDSNGGGAGRPPRAGGDRPYRGGGERF